MRSVVATRYVVPLREGGSLPAIVEADDLGMYVVKFRGAGQGPLALVAELLCGEIGQLLGLPVPELVLAELPENFGRSEPDSEIRHLLRQSAGTNFGLDYLPGASNFDVAAGDSTDAETASMTVWFDSFVQNVDRTARNPNLLLWHGKLQLIDHGAALFFHHATDDFAQKSQSPFEAVRDHVLLPFATAVDDAAKRAHTLLSETGFQKMVAEIPDAWLEPRPHGTAPHPTPEQRRATYLRYFTERLRDAPIFEQEAVRAHRIHL